MGPVTSDGKVKVSFTSTVELPEDAMERVIDEEMIQVGFIAKTYDVDIEPGKTEISSWKIEELTDNGFILQITFDEPDLVGYSLYDSD